ncbi:MAG: hypothetical protein ACRDBF_01835 [Plesiomonas shigelloides]
MNTILNELNDSIQHDESRILLAAPTQQKGIEWMAESDNRNRLITRLAEMFDKDIEPFCAEYNDGTAIVIPTRNDKMTKTFTERMITDHPDMINQRMVLNERIAGNYGIFKEFKLESSPNKGRTMISFKTDNDTLISVEIDSITLTNTHTARVLTTLASI